MMGIPERVEALVAPLLDAKGLEVVDVEHAGGVVRVTVDRAGGVNLDAIADATRAVSRALDEADPIPGRYTLEVSSPGLERPLRRPDHFARAIGSDVSIKLDARVEGDRRITGKLVGSDDTGVTVLLDDGSERTVAHSDIAKAKTVFHWGPAPKPGSPKRAGAARSPRTSTGRSGAAGVSPDTTGRASNR
ncbi:MAG: ribosome maturation factor RimP [Acidimicrobiales bacterium]|nr:ribosome maturation factor RimP [Acidimicrobiales bacterium]